MSAGTLTAIDRKNEESTGFLGPDEDHVTAFDGGHRPLSMAWISEDLLDDTIQVWSRLYRRPISRDEAVEILMNVKRFVEVMAEVRKGTGKR